MTETTPRSGSLTPPFLLDGNDRTWRVIRGGVDAFLVDLRDGQPVGARRHVFRVPAGEALLGLPAGACRSAGLLACPLPGTVVESVARRDLPLPLLEKWIDSLSQALVQRASPPPSRWVEAGVVTSIDEAPSLVRTSGAVCWLCHRAGQSVYLGVAEFSLNGTGWFPLSSAAWIEASAGSVLEAVNSSAWFSADPEGAGLDEFHRMSVVTLIRQRTEAERKERERLSVVVEREAGVVGRALRQLASPLQPGTASIEEDEEGTGGDLLLLACQAVGKAMDIHVHAPLGRQAADRIAAIARASGVRVRRVALRGQWWRENAGPMLAFRSEDKRPVALLRKGRLYRLWDPVDHTTTRVGRKAAASLEPFAWVFYRPFPERSLSLYDLLIFGLRGAQSDLTTIFLMGIGSGLLAILTPLATGLIFDQLIPGADRSGITAAALFLAVAAVVSALFGLTSNYAVLRMEGRMESATQAAVWDRLLGLPVPFFRDFDSGDLAMRSLGISEIRAALTGSTISSVLSGIFSVFSLALMFYYSLPLALLGVGLSVIAFLVPTLAGVAQIKRYRVLSSVRGRLSGMLLQFLGGIAKLRVTGKEVRAFSAWAGEFTRQKREAAAARTLSNLLVVFTSSFPLLSIAAIFYVNSALGDSKFGSLTTGQFLAFYTAFFGFLNAGLELSSSVVSVLGIVPLFERAKPILATLPEVSSAKAYPGELTGAVEVSHVFFRYRQDLPLVLNDLSVKVRAGEFVALVGASGSGKSTLVRLLLGFEQPESGAIHFDGQDLAGLDLPAVRRQIGVVLQNGKLQTGDIFQNIIGALPLTIDDAWEAARQAGLDQDIQAMPMGMYTVLSEGGGGLSGGQRQRLMIARAIVAKPRMLLFDEATSALDNQTQAIVSRSLEALKATRIVIAHRLSTIVNADRIYVVDGGSVAEEGTYQVLLQKDGLFAKLAKRQLI
jgi:NHLM bacteriocin system ABC transporter ATP-binding protein